MLSLISLLTAHPKSYHGDRDGNRERDKDGENDRNESRVRDEDEDEDDDDCRILSATSFECHNERKGSSSENRED